VGICLRWPTLIPTTPIRSSEPSRRSRRARRCASRSPDLRRRSPRPSRKSRVCTGSSLIKVAHWLRRPEGMPTGLRISRRRSEPRPNACAGLNRAEDRSAWDCLWPSSGMDGWLVAGLIRRDGCCPEPVGSVSGSLMCVVPPGWRVRPAPGDRRVAAGRCCRLLVAALRRHHARQEEERQGVGGLWLNLGLVFPNRLGRPMEPRDLLANVYRPLLERAGLPPAPSMPFGTPPRRCCCQRVSIPRWFRSCWVTPRSASRWTATAT
jgi:hypothetical protein